MEIKSVAFITNFQSFQHNAVMMSFCILQAYAVWVGAGKMHWSFGKCKWAENRWTKVSISAVSIDALN